MPFSRNPDLQAVIDGMAQGVLIFAPDGKLIMDNRAARGILGPDLAIIRENGFSAISLLLNQQLPDDGISLEDARKQAFKQSRPVRFRTYRSGEIQPCVVAGVEGPNNLIYTMITLDRPDWTPLAETMDRFGEELTNAVDSAKGHADLIQQLVDRRKPSDTADQVAKRITGFNRIIGIQMVRSTRLLSMLERLTAIRTGALREQVKTRRKPLDLTIFLEDLTEEINQSLVVDPETDMGDIRSRLKVSIEDGLKVEASPGHLTQVLHDLLANAIMYSMKATQVHISAERKASTVQIDVADEGYGIRESERDRVFTPFQRARQPQIISEFGYGLSLYLCKHEVEAMNGRIWFDSVEGSGTTFSIALPLTSSSSSKSKT